MRYTQVPSTPATMSKQHCQMLQVEQFFRQSRTLLRHCCRFWQQCRTKFRPFDKVETDWTCPICFVSVVTTKFHKKKLFDIVAKKLQQYQNNIRLCSTRQRCFDAIAAVWRGFTHSWKNDWNGNATRKISLIRDWRSTPTYCQRQSHVTQKLGQKCKNRPQ